MYMYVHKYVKKMGGERDGILVMAMRMVHNGWHMDIYSMRMQIEYWTMEP